MLFETLAQDLRLARGVNSTGITLSGRIPTKTEPTGDAGTAGGASILELRGKGAICPNSIHVVPFGTTTNNTTFDLKVLGWKKLPGNGTTLADLWVPISLAKVTCTLSNVPFGVAGTNLLAANLFCDTIVAATGQDAAAVGIESLADDMVGSFLCDLKGCDKVELIFAMGTAVDANALVAFL